jgi:hypothetical protein
MRNLLAFLAAVVLTFGGMGWYLGWYQIKAEPAAAGKRNVNIEINTVKITEDLKKGEDRLHDLINKEAKTAADAKDDKAKVEGDKAKVDADKTKKGTAAPSVFGGGELSEHR